MRSLTGLAAVATGFFAAGLAYGCEPGPLQASEPRPRVGINLSGPADFSSEQPFVDVFRLSREWISQREGAGWGQGPKLSVDGRGWIKALEPGCWAETPLCTLEGGRHYPGGTYVVLHEGEGTLDASGAASVVSRRPGRLTLTVNPALGGFFLRLLATKPGNPVRNIRVVPEDNEKTHAMNPWRPDFLDRWRGMACLRFMDLMMTNNSNIATWADRPTLDDATSTTRGVALELLIDLSNRLKIDPWFCMPHRADDDYVRRFATMVRDRLDPGLKVFVEYSNEVWNGQFQQNAHAGAQGQALGFADKTWEAAWKFTAHRSVEIFRIWDDVFGGTARTRLVRVLASQAGNSYVAEQIVSFQDAYRHADALAIAPYLSLNVAPDGKPRASQVAAWTVDQVLDHLENASLAESVTWIRDNQKVARDHGLALVAYEGGQHMVGVGGVENDEKISRLLQAANAHPRIGAIYDRYFKAWQDEGGGLFCYFSSVSPWSKWGSWGVLQYPDDDPSLAPKYQALMRWAQSLNQRVSASRLRP